MFGSLIAALCGGPTSLPFSPPGSEMTARRGGSGEGGLASDGARCVVGVRKAALRPLGTRGGMVVIAHALAPSPSSLHIRMLTCSMVHGA